MDNQTYLDQIAASTRPQKSSTMQSIFKNNIVKIVAGVIGAFILIILVGSILGGIRDGKRQEVIDFKARLDGITESINTYQGSVKSSSLRSQSASLYAIVHTTSTATNDYMTAQGIKGKQSEDEDKAKEERNNDLQEAKINGLLDRAYARKFAYEISVLMATESKLIKEAKTNEFKTALESSYNSLSVLKDSFTSFSASK